MEGGSVRLAIYEYALTTIVLWFWIVAAHAADKPDYGFKGEYILQRAVYDDEVCKRFKDNLNRFRKLDFDTCHPRMSDKFPEFSRPYQWQEIPFDMALAEKAIKSSQWLDTTDASMLEHVKLAGEKLWSAWLKSTEQLRAQGKARMWTTQMDIDDDGKPETLLRLEPQGRYGFDPMQTDIYHCDYDRGELYVIEAMNPKAAGRFNRSSLNAGDMIQDGKSGHRYLLYWARRQAARVGAWFFPDQGPMPDIGATRGVVVRSMSPMHNSTEFNPGIDICIIDWVPTGKHKPAPRQQGK